ncbi:MAG: hypothetical protein NTY45_13845 [Elusimicrobia bacterium]|nr:hypothetical protein [Elusimicrobiota bacterium]
MKHLILSLFCPAAAALLLCAASQKTAQDCSKTSDACSAAPAARSPFLEASANPDRAVASHKPGKAVKKAEQAQAAPAQPAAAAVEVATAPAVPASPAAEQKTSAFSNPLWTFFAAGGLGGLYMYLKNGSGKRRRK